MWQHGGMVNPSNDNLGPGEGSPLDDDGLKLPQAPGEESVRGEGKREAEKPHPLTELGFPADLFDFFKQDPWEQEKAPPVNREVIRRFVRDQLPEEEKFQVIELLSQWENWHKAELEESKAYALEQIPPVDREAVRRYVRGELTGKELNWVTEMISTWRVWGDAHREEVAKLSRQQGTA
jgi:hypothetical protein